MPESGSKAVAKTAESQAEKASTVEKELLSVAKTFEEKQAAFQLAAGLRQSQMIARAAEAIAAESWGAKLSPIHRAAIARYALETGTDPIRHWYVLGGRLYDNAELWYDVAASQPDYAGADNPILIHDDPRCTEDERAKRRALRAAWGCPEDTPGAAIVTIHTKERGSFSGCNWVKTGTYSDGKPRDPVGREHPAQSAITRAWRKACKKAWSIWFLRHPSLKSSEEVLVQGRTVVPPIVGSNEPSGPEEDETPAIEVAEVAAVSTRTQPKTGVIEKHTPSAICGFAQEHPRERCGYYQDKKEPPAS